MQKRNPARMRTVCKAIAGVATLVAFGSGHRIDACPLQHCVYNYDRLGHQSLASSAATTCMTRLSCCNSLCLLNQTLLRLSRHVPVATQTLLAAQLLDRPAPTPRRLKMALHCRLSLRSRQLNTECLSCSMCAPSSTVTPAR